MNACSISAGTGFTPANFAKQGSFTKRAMADSMAKRLRCQYIFVGHKASVNAVIAASGMVYSGSSDKTIRVWSLSDLKCRDTLKGHTGAVLSMCYSAADGGYLYSGSEDASIRVWKVGKPKASVCVETKRDHTRPVTAVKLVGQFLVSGSDDGSIFIWSVEPGGRLLALEKISDAHEGGIRCLASYKDFLFSGADDGRVKVWNLGELDGNDPRTPQCIVLLAEYESPVRALAVQGGTLVAAGSKVKLLDVGKIKKWRDFEALRPHKVIEDSTVGTSADRASEPVTTLYPGFTGSDQFVSASADGTVRVWDGHQRCRGFATDHKDRVHAFADTKIYFNPILLAGSYLFTASSDMTVKCYLLGDKELNYKWLSAAERTTLAAWAQADQEAGGMEG
eukprot:tig00021720_g23181.t1